MNKVNVKDQISRMKTLMGYGLQTESKNTTYASIEHQRVGADGNVYGIIREGSKYYIKTAPKKKNLVKEDFQYIGGFRNRKDNEYSSFANAEKQFDLKMMSLKESYANGKNIVVESWNPDKKENLSIEATDKMKKEILRERQIMHNATMISEKKEISKDIEATQKKNIKKGKHENGKPVDSVYTEKPGSAEDMEETCKNECNNIKEESEPLAWHKEGGDAQENMNDTYMDKSNGTEKGCGKPFCDAEVKKCDGKNKECCAMHEESAMHNSENQNTPKPGVGEGPSDETNKPFDDEMGKQVDEAITDFGEDVDDDTESDVEDVDDEGGDIDGIGDESDADVEGDDIDADADIDLDVDEIEDDEDELESRVSNIEDLLDKIADKLGVDEFEDDNLYDDEEVDDDDDNKEEDEYLFDFEDGDNDENEDEVEDDTLPESYIRNGVQIFESRAYRRAMNEEGQKPFTDNGRVPSGNMNTLKDFGKHPAYRKEVMSLPPKDLQEFPDYYDMNDDSVKSGEPYGKNIGDGTPFEIDTEQLENAIAESIQRILKKKSNRR